MRQIVKRTQLRDLSQWTVLEGEFTAERYEGEARLLDTGVDIHIKDICITWDKQEEFMDELAKVLKRYMI